MLDATLHCLMGDVVPHVRDCLKAGLVPMLRGSPGISKSAVFHMIADEDELLVIDARFAGYDPTDINGFPDLDRETGIASYYPLDTFPLEDRELPMNPKTGRPYRGWLVLCDELTSAPGAVQAASYKLFLDRMVGQRKLHPEVRLAAAGNLDTDNAITHEMSTALISRLINFVVLPDFKFWMKWAQGEGGIRPIITSFLEWRQNAFYTFDNAQPNQPFASPRTWEFVNSLLNVWNGNPIGKLVPIAGCINMTAVDFLAFANFRRDLPKKADIMADPTKAPIPDEYNPGPMFALTGALADWFECDKAEQWMKYIERLNGEFAVITMRSIIRKNGMAVMGIPVVSKWMDENCDALAL